MNTSAEILQQATEHFHAGRLDLAEQLCRQIVAAEPDQAGAWRLLGARLAMAERWDEATACFRKLLELDPRDATAHQNLGLMWQARGDFAAAIDCHRQAVALQPGFAEAHACLGMALQKCGQLAAAATSYSTALELNPQDAKAAYNLATVLMVTDRLAEAETCLRASLARRADQVDSQALLNVVWARQGQWQAARDGCLQVLRVRPDDAETLSNLGNALRELGQLDEALVHAERARRLRPDLHFAHSCLGVLYRQLGRTAEARQAFERAIELEPTRALYHCNLAVVLQIEGRLPEAVAHYEQALALDPQLKDARCGRGMQLLAQEKFAEGWAEYEHRVGLKDFDTRQLPEPRWQGEPLAGRTLLVHAEQGYGDTLQFVRYLKLAEQQGGRVIAAVQPALIPLLQQSGYANLVSLAEPFPPCDVQAPLLSLPGIFRTTLATIPREIPYLDAQPELTRTWRQRLARIEGFRVGIIWQGNPRFVADAFRSIPLSQFEPLARVPGVTLISLQQIRGTEQIAQVADRFEVTQLGELGQHPGPFMDSAAVMKNLDLVISSDTGPAHLAGGLGVPVWVALSTSSDWRWFLHRADCPWYPTMRLFRQANAGDWNSVFRKMADELAKEVKA